MSIRKSATALTDSEDLLIHGRSQIADQEARNGLLQFDEVQRLVAINAPAQKLNFTIELIQALNRIAIQGIRRSAGLFRSGPIQITNTPHQPPPHEGVTNHVEEMCSYVNANWDAGLDAVADALHILAFLMWRLNWIHPFRDGNGRTSRAASYLALSVRLGRELPGTPTVADQITGSKMPYYAALDAADAAWSVGQVDVTAMESLISELLSVQLSSVSD